MAKKLWKGLERTILNNFLAAITLCLPYDELQV